MPAQSLFSDAYLDSKSCLNAYFDLHSIIETAKKHKQTPFEAIRALFGATDSSAVPIAE